MTVIGSLTADSNSRRAFQAADLRLMLRERSTVNTAATSVDETEVAPSSSPPISRKTEKMAGKHPDDSRRDQHADEVEPAPVRP